MRKSTAFLICLLACGSSYACSPPLLSEEPWVRDKHAVKGRELPPTLVVTSEAQRRPEIARNGWAIGCDQFASFVIRIQLSSNATAALSDFGYLFRVRSKGPLVVAPDYYPVHAKIVDGFAVFEIYVMDTGSEQLAPIGIEMDVQALDSRFRRGPRTRFQLRAMPNGQMDGT